MSLDATVTSHVDIAGRASAPARQTIRLLVLVAGAASLAACMQTTTVSQRSEFAPSRQASFERNRTALIAMKKRVAATRKHARIAARRSGDTKVASQGVASFYTEGTKTASGEKFNTLEMTAAHPSLPFGTKLRVTNVKTGQSVTVRVNDRGPYVRGRIVDVSYSAAQELGMIGKGVASVKLDVVQ